jgi:hypothetical protein
MEEPEYDIFSGEPDGSALWVESVKGLTLARARMDQIAAEKPGEYFLFSTATNAVVARPSAAAQPEARRKASGAA